VSLGAIELRSFLWIDALGVDAEIDCSSSSDPSAIE
jgi:hypothetical protein